MLIVLNWRHGNASQYWCSQALSEISNWWAPSTEKIRKDEKQLPGRQRELVWRARGMGVPLISAICKEESWAGSITLIFLNQKGCHIMSITSNLYTQNTSHSTGDKVDTQLIFTITIEASHSFIRYIYHCSLWTTINTVTYIMLL